MTQINIVFWFLVIVGLAAVWFLLSSCFSELGEKIINLIHGTKENIQEDDEYEEEETL